MTPASAPISVLESPLALEMEFVREMHPANDRDGHAGSPRSEGTRAAIMAAARPIFVRRGYQGTRLAAIAREAWVAPSTVSLHFKGKEALFAACLEQEIDWLFEEAHRGMHGHPLPQLSGDYLRVLASELPKHPLLSTALVLSPHRWGQRFYESRHLGNSRRALFAELRRAQQANLAPADLDVIAVGDALTHVQAMSLWTAVAAEGVDDAGISRIITVIQASALVPGARERVEQIAHPWRQRREATLRGSASSNVASLSTSKERG